MYNSKNIHCPNKQLDLKRTMSELGKPFRRKSEQKFLKNIAGRLLENSRR